MLKVLNQVHD